MATGAAVATAVLLAGWFLLLAAFAAATRTPSARPGPATGELGPESPAVVDLITGGYVLCDEAASATLLDLAARRVLTIEEIGPELSLVRLGRNAPDTPLTTYERRVLEHVRRLATADGVVPTGALAEGSRNLGGWWKSFTKEVVAEARAAGLSEPRWHRWHRLVLLGAAAVPGLAVGVTASLLLPRDEDGPLGTVVAATIMVAFGLGAIVEKLAVERGTAAGAAAAARWLGVREHLERGRFAEAPAASVTIWGRPLAYAAALGLAPRAVVSLPVSTPADDNRAWSDQGGMWHVVQVAYRGPWPWGRFFWGRSPGQQLLRVLIGAIPAFGLCFVLGILGAALLDLPIDPPVVGWLGAAVVCGVPLVGVLVDAAHPVQVEGQVVRLRRFVRSQSENSTTWDHYVGLDEGTAPKVRALGIDGDRWHELAEGDVVRGMAGRRSGWLKDVEIIRPSRMRPGPAPSAEGDGNVRS